MLGSRLLASHADAVCACSQWLKRSWLWEGVPGRGSSMCKARNMRAVGGRPWADGGRGFAVVVTHGKVCPRTLEKGDFENSWRFHYCSRR